MEFARGVTLRRSTIPLAACVAVGALLTGCTMNDEAAPVPTGPAYEVVPEPGRTVPATPPSTLSGFDGAHFAVVIPDDSAVSTSLLRATREVAQDAGAQLTEFRAEGGSDGAREKALRAAIDAEPDVIIGLGEGSVDTFDTESAQWLDRQFLIVGAQLAEPTANVTAVVWSGATSRGSAASADDDTDGSVVPDQRGRRAVAAGLDSIADDSMGIVLFLE